MKYILLIAGLGLCITGHAQYVPFLSNHMQNGNLVNPAETGNSDAMEAGLYFRRQWLKFEGSPTSAQFTVHSALRNEKIGLGVIAFRHESGLTSRTGITVQCRYKAYIDRWSDIQFGMSGSLENQSFQWQDAVVNYDNDPVIASGGQSSLLPNFGAGAHYRIRNLYAGLSIPRFFQVESGALHFSIQSQHAIVYAGLKLENHPKITWRFEAMLRNYSDIDFIPELQAVAQFSGIIQTGLGFRPGNSAMAMVGMHVTDQLRLSYAFDYFSNDMRYYNSGSHEVTLRYSFQYNTDARSTRFF